MKFSDEELEIMREFVKNMDHYELIRLKGQLSKKLMEEGKSRDEIYKKFIEFGNDLNKYRENLKLKE